MMMNNSDSPKIDLSVPVCVELVDELIQGVCGEWNIDALKENWEDSHQ